jgi:thioredoxin 1
MSDLVKEVTEESYQTDVEKAEGLFLLDFWAPWCGPCKMIAPVLDELASEYSDKITIGKLNVDKSPSIAGKHGVQSIPTVLFIKNGEIVDSFVGFMAKDAIKEKINALV